MGQDDTPKRGRPRAREEATPLGSLSQGGASVPAGTEACASCASTSLTRLGMVLGDGTAVVFVSCHRCEHNEDVLARSGKKA
jgi:hypothetical protein